MALSGGSFQNRILLQGVSDTLEGRGLTVLTHCQVPANDGGLALGQAAIAAARAIETGTPRAERGQHVPRHSRQIVAISDADNSLAMVDVSGVPRQINIVCVVSDDHPIDACVGDWVLVHVGFAMSRIDGGRQRRP